VPRERHRATIRQQLQTPKAIAESLAIALVLAATTISGDLAGTRILNKLIVFFVVYAIVLIVFLKCLPVFSRQLRTAGSIESSRGSSNRDHPSKCESGHPLWQRPLGNTIRSPTWARIHPKAKSAPQEQLQELRPLFLTHFVPPGARPLFSPVATTVVARQDKIEERKKRPNGHLLFA
jgi:hypothetical protein